MPNQPRTPSRHVRVDDDVWQPARAKAAGEGRTISDVIRDLLRRWVEEK